MGRLPDKDLMLELVPKDGLAIGNVSLRPNLGWPEDKYWRIRDELLADGKLGLTRGRGGGVYRTSAAQASAWIRGAP
jgi:adenine-specific DNA-methyltransferase